MSCCQTLTADLVGLSQDSMQAAQCVLNRVNRKPYLSCLSLNVRFAHTVTKPAEDTLSSLHAVPWQANKVCHESLTAWRLDQVQQVFLCAIHAQVNMYQTPVLTLPSGDLQPPHSRALPGASVHLSVPARALVLQGASAGCT